MKREWLRVMKREGCRNGEDVRLENIDEGALDIKENTSSCVKSEKTESTFVMKRNEKLVEESTMTPWTYHQHFVEENVMGEDLDKYLFQRWRHFNFFLFLIRIFL